LYYNNIFTETISEVKPKMDTLTSIVYALAALAGQATYVWWKWPNDEEFNPKKPLNH
jgi:hypothetical protein